LCPDQWPTEWAEACADTSSKVVAARDASFVEMVDFWVMMSASVVRLEDRINPGQLTRPELAVVFGKWKLIRGRAMAAVLYCLPVKNARSAGIVDCNFLAEE
jgi:hypothetical protein